MSSRSRSPEKRKPPNPRDPPPTDHLRSSIEAASRRLEKGNPQTPPAQRFVSSTYSSPGSILSREEDAIIVELNARYLLAGIEGESSPQCRLNFTPSSERRVGDYREHIPGYLRKQESLDLWGQPYELWRNDITGLDMGLLSDKLERTVREVYNRFLLVDAGSARLVLVLPSVVPLPVLDTILSTLFERWRYPSITLLPAPTMSAFAAGLRSGLVIDIGWEEIVVTSIYEYREIKTHRSTRAMKTLTTKVSTALQVLLQKHDDHAGFRLDLDFVEELITRTMALLGPADPDELSRHAAKLSLAEDRKQRPDGESRGLFFDWRSQTSAKCIKIPSSIIFEAIESTLLSDQDDTYADDNERSISQLIYDALLAMSADVRAMCASRILFTGQCANVSALKDRILDAVRTRLRVNGWSSVKGNNVKWQQNGLSALDEHNASSSDARHGSPLDAGKDYVEERIRKAKERRGEHGTSRSGIQEVMSLGSWAGASLLTNLKVRGFVEIERERFLSHGVSGANRDIEISVVPQPQRASSFGIPKTAKAQDRTSWTLAGWG